MTRAAEIATIVAAIAAVATFAIVIVDLRSLAKTSHDNLVGQQQARLDAHHAVVMADPDLAALYFRGLLSVDELRGAGDDEITRIFYLLATHVGHYETLALQDATRAEWEEAFKDYLRTDLYRLYWQADRHTLTDQFADRVDALVGGSPTPEAKGRLPLEVFAGLVRSTPTKQRRPRATAPAQRRRK